MLGRAGWLIVALVVTVAVAGALSVIPSAATGLQSFLGTSSGTGSSDPGQPVWNTGNLCPTPLPGVGTLHVSCMNTQSGTTLVENFSSTLQGGYVNILITGSNDCIYLNFHSFYTDITITLKGSHYACVSTSASGEKNPSITLCGNGCGGGTGPSGCPTNYGGPGFGWLPPDGGADWSKKTTCSPGVNIAINSEGDTLNLIQKGCDYSTNVTVYGTTTIVKTTQYGDELNTVVTYIGIEPGFSVCPDGITYGKVTWKWITYGSYDKFTTILVDAKTPPPISPLHYVHVYPPDWIFGTHDYYGTETTTTAPPGSCHYLAK